MATIEKSATLVKAIALSNLTAADGLAVTPMLNGRHGIGKSQILNSTAKALGGYCFVVEGGSLKEGEITGLPFAQQNSDGSSEVRFIRYHMINKIWQLEKKIYEIATTTGFMGGKIKLEVDPEGNKYLIYPNEKTGTSERVLVSDAFDNAIAGEENKYKFGAELPGALKLKLIESDEIKLVLLFIDELNRTEQQTMKELMNIILNRSVNGYDLPWWVSVVSAINPCSQNSSYATNELDDAQMDRFLNIKVDADLEDWINYQLSKHAGENTDIIEGVAISEAIFLQKDSSHEDKTEMTPSPRSWEMCMHLYNSLEGLYKSKFFTPEERSGWQDDLRILLRGKVGETAARTVLENISNKANNIKPAEILTLKAPVLDKDVAEKFKKQKSLTKTIISANVINYMCNIINDVYKGKTSADPKAKAAWTNFQGQLKEFALLMDKSTQILFVKKIVQIGGIQLYTKVSKAFSADVLAQVMESKAAIKDLTSE